MAWRIPSVTDRAREQLHHRLTFPGRCVHVSQRSAFRIIGRPHQSHPNQFVWQASCIAPSVKAALEAWGADSNLFHQGVAKESTDPDVIAATMAKPGVVLKRPVGSDGLFGEHAVLPKNLDQDGPKKSASKPAGPKAKKSSGRTGCT
jgi:hypothetical protein